MTSENRINTPSVRASVRASVTQRYLKINPASPTSKSRQDNSVLSRHSYECSGYLVNTTSTIRLSEGNCASQQCEVGGRGGHDNTLATINIFFPVRCYKM